MGLTESNPKQVQVKKYTDNEIKDNISRLFKDNRKNNFTEASMSMRDLDNAVISDDNQHYQNGGKKFRSSKNRHLKYNIEDYISSLQLGGNPIDDHKEISEASEFKKIRDFLIKDVKQNGGNLKEISEASEFKKIRDYLTKDVQSGGDIDIEALINGMGSPISSDKRQLTLANVLVGGELDDDNDDEEESENDFDDNFEDSDEENIENIEDDSDEESKDENENEDDPENKKKETFSETSLSKSPELNNLLPFYSTDNDDSDEKKHPYIKNRFNH